MKLKDIINKVDRSNPDSWTNLEPIAKEFDIYDYLNGHDCRLKSFFYQKWLCTDTWVGGRVYFLDDTIVCISYQSARKSDENFRWISKELFDLTYQYLLTLKEEDNPKFSPEIITKKELDYDSEGFTLEYCEQFLTKNVIDKETGKEVRIMETIERADFPSLSNHFRVEFENEETKIVKATELIVPYNVKEE